MDREDKFLNRLMVVCIILMIIYVIVLSIVLIVLIVNKAQGMDLGVQGNTWEIRESDPIEDIKNKIKAMELNGEIDKHN
jgi:predicted PurR-regulated permease PerM